MSVAPSKQLRAEIRRASGAYGLLWVSPVVTVPATLYLAVTIGGSISRSNCANGIVSCEIINRVPLLAGILMSAAFHLLLLRPALDPTHAFVRWHGRQALLLAGVRTAIPLAAVLAFGFDYPALLAIPALMLVWLVGNLWAQSQAAGGDCTLMRLAGQGAGLPLPIWQLAPAAPSPASKPIGSTSSVVDALVKVIQNVRDAAQREMALAQLRRLGAVEDL